MSGEGFDLNEPRAGGDPDLQEAHNRLYSYRTERAHQGLSALLSLPEGRIWFWRLLEACHVFSTSFTTDPLLMAFREGERAVGLSLMAQLREDQLAALQRENMGQP